MVSGLPGARYYGHCIQVMAGSKVIARASRSRWVRRRDAKFRHGGTPGLFCRTGTRDAGLRRSEENVSCIGCLCIMPASFINVAKFILVTGQNVEKATS